MSKAKGPVEDEEFQADVAYYLAQKALEDMAAGGAAPGKTDKLRGPRKLSDSEANQKHIKALARRIMEDPSFPMLLETARKMAEKYPNALEELQ